MEIYSHDIDRFPGLRPVCMFHLYDQLFTISEHSWGVVWELFFLDGGRGTAITQIIWSHQALEWLFPESFIWQISTEHFVGARDGAGDGVERGVRSEWPRGSHQELGRHQKNKQTPLPPIQLSAGVGGPRSPGTGLGAVGGLGRL